MKRLGDEGEKFQLGPLHVGIKETDAGEIDGTCPAEYLVLFELEVHAQALDDLRVGARLDLKANSIALAAIVKLNTNGLEKRTRFFLFKVEVGVAGDAKGRMRQHLVAAIHGGKVLGDQVLEEQVIEAPLGSGETNKARQCARHSDHAEDLGAGAATF